MNASFRRGAISSLVAATLSFGLLAGCDDGPTTPGQALDKGIRETGDAVKRAGEAIKDAGR